MRRVAALDVGAERPALDRLAENRRRASGAEILRGGAIRGIELAVVVAAARKGVQLVVGEVGDHLTQARVGSEEVLACVVAVFHRVTLELAVDSGVHAIEQHAVLVLCEQFVPLGTPDHLDHVPARAAEHRFEFLNDLAVTAHRTVETLQVAVDDEDEVVELLA